MAEIKINTPVVDVEVSLGEEPDVEVVHPCSVEGCDRTTNVRRNLCGVHFWAARGALGG